MVDDLIKYVQSLSHVRLFAAPWTVACQARMSMEFPRQGYWNDCHFLLQVIFLTQGSNLCLSSFLHWQVHSLPLAPQNTPVLLPGKSHGWRSLEGCSPWGRWGSDTTEVTQHQQHHHHRKLPNKVTYEREREKKRDHFKQFVDFFFLDTPCPLILNET